MGGNPGEWDLGPSCQDGVCYDNFLKEYICKSQRDNCHVEFTVEINTYFLPFFHEDAC